MTRPVRHVERTCAAADFQALASGERAPVL